MISNRKKVLTRYLLIHLAILLYGVFILLLARASRRLGFGFSCLSHDLIGIYCPFCGGTRALSALLRFDLLSALSYNAAFVFTIPFFLFFDVRALWLILRDRASNRRLCPKWAAVTVAAIFALYFIVRNLLVFGFGIDFAGDFQ